MIGLILSDGYIRNKKGNSKRTYFEIKQTQKREEFIDFLVEYFNIKGVYCKKRYDKSNKKYGEQPTLSSINYRFLGRMRIKWYPNGIKIVPRDLILTPKILAYWYMGDGGIWKSKRGSVKLTLYTDSFSFNDIQFLIFKLGELGIEFKYCKRGNGYIIYTSKAKNVTNFLKTIEPYLLKTFNYKLKYPTCRQQSFNNLK